MKILGIERDDTACSHYRILQPLYKLQQHGLAEVITIPEQDLACEEAVDKMMLADVVVFQRPANEEWFRFIKTCQKAGKIIITDYDDDPFNTSPFNPYYKFTGVRNWAFKWPDGRVDVIWQDGENIDIERNIVRQDMFRASFRRADMVTTTTPILRETFKTLNENTVALPNLIDFNYFKRYQFKKKEVRIGYQCGASHYEDIYLVRESIREVVKKYDNVKFVYFGDLRFRNLFQSIPSGKIELHDWVKNIAYPYKLALMNLDIGICPLVDNEFNRNKSALKYFEYSATGAATVASDIPPYSPVMRHDENGLLAKDHKQWVDALSELIENEQKRQTIAENAYNYVYEEHNADKKPRLWLQAYQDAIKAVV